MNNIVILSSIEFIFRFLPVCLLAYLLTPAKYRDTTLFLESLVFYAVGEPVFVLLLLGLTLVNYLTGEILYLDRGKTRSRGAVAATMIAIDAGVLTLCKVLALTVDSSFLPIGLSFYIFKMISYQADLYRGKIQTRPTLIRTAAYFMLFPQVTQGPIMRYGVGFDRGEHRTSLDQFEEGLVYVVMGLGMKILLADRLGILWNEIHKIGYESISTPLAWLGAYGYSLQLYFDFWGYSLIASGVLVMMGFPFVENFIHPYAAGSISDFYRRWHATLGSWFRDYIYFPLGGSRRGSARTVANLLIVWLVTGLWHGGTLNFVIWGMVLGVIIVLEKFVFQKILPVLGRFNVLVLIPLTWVVFAIPNLRELGTYFGRLFPFFGIGKTLDPSDFQRYWGMFWPYFLSGGVLCVPKVYEILVKHRRNVLVVLLLAAVFWVSVYFMANSSGNTFMYFNF